ncbi:IS1595 family transposase [Asinibacterium sp. OR53]|uniref:IS1595 family transposase n=1 Tax=Asinibacterium sp. OR53 TaxID=925409 RepID=UPI00047D49FC|nr:IS1595 family transposase [Asinibacterium sp. OR53]
MFSATPFKSILELIKAFPDEQSCIDHLERVLWDGTPVSPFDPASQVYKCKNNRYKCKNTNKYFNVKIGTIFEGTKISLQVWYMAMYIFSSHKKGISSHQLAKDLDVTQKTAWFILERLREAMNTESFKEEMEGVIEVDETFVGGKNRNRHHDKKVKNSQGRSFKDKTPVVGLLNREGNVRCFVVPDTSIESVQPIVRENVKKGSIVISDEWKAYKGLNNDYTHMVVEHGKGQYVNDEGGTTNSIENVWSNFKKGIIGIYHNRPTRKHLQGYADEFAFRYNTRKDSTDGRFNVLLSETKGKRLTYQNLIAK